jgi:hypothetical protein
MEPTYQDRTLAMQITCYLVLGPNHPALDTLAQMIADHTYAVCDEAVRQVVSQYEDVLTDHRRLVRDIDVIMNGEEGAAKQASLCDLGGQIRDWANALSRYEEAYIDSCHHCHEEAFTEWEMEKANLEMDRLAREEKEKETL